MHLVLLPLQDFLESFEEEGGKLGFAFGIGGKINTGASGVEGFDNFVFEIDIRESIERKTFFLKSYEKDRMSFLLNNSKKSNILIDIGAHIGFYSILTSEYFKQVYSFEPNFRNYQILKFVFSLI